MHVKIGKIPRAAKYKQNVKQRHFGTCVTRIGWIRWSCFQWTLKAEIFICKGRLWWDFQVRQEVMSLELLSELNKKSNRTSMDEGASGHNMMHRSMLIMYDQQLWYMINSCIIAWSTKFIRDQQPFISWWRLFMQLFMRFMSNYLLLSTAKHWC